MTNCDDTVLQLSIFAILKCSFISDISLTPGLTVIGKSMFKMGMGGGSTVLSSVTIPSTVTSIGELLWTFWTKTRSAFRSNELLVAVFEDVIVVSMLGDENKAPSFRFFDFLV